MKSLACSLLFFSLLLASCNPPEASPHTEQTSAAQRTAVFQQMENDVRARLESGEDYQPAFTGLSLHISGAARTFEDSRARLDLIPEGTIVRLGPNTLFELQELGQDAAAPTTLLDLLDGHLWILLAGGELEVRTEAGSAAVRGSLMNVSYNAEHKSLAVTCLEGHCAIFNSLGRTELSSGQASEIRSPDQPPLPPRPMTAEEIQEWFTENPEIADFLPDGFVPSPPGQPGRGPDPAPGATPPSGPLRYTLNNNCPNATVWHWIFEGRQTFYVDVPPGQTASGELPEDNYYATDYFDNGPSHGPTFTPGGGHLQVASCP